MVAKRRVEWKPIVKLTECYTKTDLVFGFSKNQILAAVIPEQKAPRTFPGQKTSRTLLGQNCFWIIAENHFEMSIKQHFK